MGKDLIHLEHCNRILFPQGEVDQFSVRGYCTGGFDFGCSSGHEKVSLLSKVARGGDESENAYDIIEGIQTEKVSTHDSREVQKHCRCSCGHSAVESSDQSGAEGIRSDIEDVESAII